MGAPEKRRKIKRLLPVNCSGSSAHPRPQILPDGGHVKRTNQNSIHYIICAKVVTFPATSNSYRTKTQEIVTLLVHETPLNVRLSAAKIRFAQSKLGLVYTEVR